MKKFLLIFAILILAACGADAPEPYTSEPYTPEPPPPPAESLAPIGNTFAATGEGILMIKEDGGLWHRGQNGEISQILEDAVSVWAGQANFALRADGSLWNLDNLDAPRLFLEGVAYFDGRFHVIKFDGGLWCWGWDNIPIHIMDDVVAFSTWLPGGNANMAITADSRLWTWGVWDGNLENHPEPVFIMENIAAVSAARMHMTALCYDGYLWEWDVDGGERTSPVRVMDNVVAISADTNAGANPFNSTLAIRADGSLWGWGFGYWIPPAGINPIPAEIWHDAVQIVRGWRTIMVITSNGELWDLTHEPALVMERVAAASMSLRPALALDFDGGLWTWEQEIDQFGDMPLPFGTSNDPRHFPAQIADGVLLPTLRARCDCGEGFADEMRRRPTPPMNIRETWDDPAEILQGFENVHRLTYQQFETDWYSTIILWPDSPVSDFSFVSLDVANHYWEEDTRLVIDTREVLLTIDRLAPTDAVVLNVAFAHYLLPHAAIIFTDNENNRQRMFITESMRGGCFPAFHLMPHNPEWTADWE